MCALLIKTNALRIANKQQDLKNKGRAAALIVANKLAFQSVQKKKPAAGLVIAGNELLFQNTEMAAESVLQIAGR